MIMRCVWAVTMCWLWFWLAGSQTFAVDVIRDPLCSGGGCDIDSVSILGAATDTPLEVNVLFPDMKHIELDAGGASTTNAEFAINNTVNSADLIYRITMDLADLQGNLLTSGLLVHTDTAPANLSHLVQLPLTPLPPALVFNEVQFFVETECAIPGACSTFDFLAAGGGGSGTGASGPIRFNRAQGGFSIPEPHGFAWLYGIAGWLAYWRSRPQS